MGGRLKREGIYVYIQLIYFVVQQKLTQHCKAVVLQFFFFLNIGAVVRRKYCTNPTQWRLSLMSRAAVSAPKAIVNRCNQEGLPARRVECVKAM